MFIAILGFTLLAVLVLGGALFLLSLLLLGVALGLQALVAIVALGPGGGAVLSLATSIQLAAGSGFALGLLLVIVGSASLFFTVIRTFLKGLFLLLQFAANSVPFFGFLPDALRSVATLIEAVKGVVTGTNSVSEKLHLAGDALNTAGNNIEIPTVVPQTESLRDLLGPAAPDIHVVTSLVFGTAPTDTPPISLVVDGLTNTGDRVNDVGDKADGIGSDLGDIATAINGIATLIEEATQ